MAAKVTTPQQHGMLHAHWPTDCCLCRAEGERDRCERVLEDVMFFFEQATNTADEHVHDQYRRACVRYREAVKA